MNKWMRGVFFHTAYFFMRFILLLHESVIFAAELCSLKGGIQFVYPLISQWASGLLRFWWLCIKLVQTLTSRCVCVWEREYENTLILLGWTPRSGIAGLDSKRLHVSSILKTEQSFGSGKETQWRGEGGRSFQEEKSRNKWVEITGTLGNQHCGDLTAVCGRGWLTGNICWDQKLEASRPRTEPLFCGQRRDIDVF